mgnify:CR=1 FL=1
MASDATPQDYERLQHRLTELHGTLPKRLRQCAEYVLRDPDRVAFDTVAQAAAAAAVQPSAMIRFSKLLGYSGFSEMQQVFRTRLSGIWPDYPTRLERLRAAGAESPEGLLAEFAEVSRLSLERLTARIAPETLRRAVDRLTAARLIHVVGLRRAYAVATYLAYALQRVGRPTVLHETGGALEQTALFDPGDAMLAISFQPYTGQTIALAETARAAGVSVVAITDSTVSPLAKHAEMVLEVEEPDVGAFRSLSATFCLATTLAVATGARQAGG